MPSSSHSLPVMMKKEGYSCPECGSLIPLDDINASHNLALCRTCSKTFTWSDLEDEEKADKVLSNVPRHLKVQKTARGVLLTYKKNNKAVSLFLILFTLIWNGIICAALFDIISNMWRINQGVESFHFNSKVVVFIPFILFGLVVFLGTLLFTFGKTELEVFKGEGTLFRGIGSLGKKWCFLLPKDIRFSYNITVQSYDQPTKWLVLSQPGGKDFRLGSAIDADALEFIRIFLKKCAHKHP